MCSCILIVCTILLIYVLYVRNRVCFTNKIKYILSSGTTKSPFGNFTGPPPYGSPRYGEPPYTYYPIYQPLPYGVRY